MATDAGAGPDVTAFERIGVPNVPYPPYNQLDAQIAGLRAQLMVAEEQLRRTEGMLRRADENLGRRQSGGGADDDEERRRLNGELSVPLRRWDSPPR